MASVGAEGQLTEIRRQGRARIMKEKGLKSESEEILGEDPQLNLDLHSKL